jgi:hypothetical protein
MDLLSAFRLHQQGPSSTLGIAIGLDTFRLLSYPVGYHRTNFDGRPFSDPGRRMNSRFEISVVSSLFRFLRARERITGLSLGHSHREPEARRLGPLVSSQALRVIRIVFMGFCGTNKIP